MAELELADGRKLAYEDGGDPDGTPIIHQHGTGDSRLARHPDEAATAALGIRLITVDRPGVGGSSPEKGRSILDWVPDVEALADALGLGEFVVTGHSGGGPHALAIANALGSRVTKVGLASPLAPFDEPGTKQMVKNSDLKLIFKLSHLKFLANAVGKSESKHYLKDLGGFVAHMADDDPSDRSVFLDEALEPMWEAQFGAAFAHGGVGALDDMWAFLEWGFAPEDVTQPVELFCGDTDDILDPEMSSRLAARLPECSSHTWVGAGHYGLFHHWDEFFGSVVAP